MPHKDPAARKAMHKKASAKHYQKNKDGIKAKAKADGAAGREAWRRFKDTLACSVCGFAHPAVIDFHHPPGTKKYGVNDLVADRRFTKAYEEIKKCIILCSNCHRIHHYNEKGAQKEPLQEQRTYS